jgi:hypothetical protein
MLLALPQEELPPVADYHILAEEKSVLVVKDFILLVEVVAEEAVAEVNLLLVLQKLPLSKLTDIQR